MGYFLNLCKLTDESDGEINIENWLVFDKVREKIVAQF